MDGLAPTPDPGPAGRDQGYKYAAPNGAFDQRLVTASYAASLVSYIKNMSKNRTFITFYEGHFITGAVKVIVNDYRNRRGYLRT
jgi:hypothetical protein